MIATTAMTDAQLDRIAHDRFLAAMDAVRSGDRLGMLAYLCGAGTLPQQRTSPRRPLGSIGWIKAEVALLHDLDTSALEAQDQSAHVSRARHVAMYLARRITGRSLARIGREFGGRDHTTVLLAIRKIEKLRTADSDLDALLATVESQVERARP